jgi:putative membrane protein
MESVMTSNPRRRLALSFIFAAAAVSAAGVDIATAQNAGAPAAVSSAPSLLSPVDYNFVAQANLGAPFQVDSGRLAEKKATTAAIRDYAHLMVVSHIPVVDALNAVLQHKGIAAPPNTLLRGAYDTMIASLKIEHYAAFDRDYVDGQVEYQEGNTALFQGEIENGTDPELKAFARQTLPKIEDHLQRALTLAEHAKAGATTE